VRGVHTGTVQTTSRSLHGLAGLLISRALQHRYRTRTA
jgi:hypothetical protein